MFISKQLIGDLDYNLIPRKSFAYLTIEEAQVLTLDIAEYFEKQKIKPGVKFISKKIYGATFPAFPQVGQKYANINKSEIEKLHLTEVVKFFPKLSYLSPIGNSEGIKGIDYNLTVAYRFNNVRDVTFEIHSETTEINDGEPDIGFEVSKTYPIGMDCYYHWNTDSLKIITSKKIKDFEKDVEEEYRKMVEFCLKKRKSL